MPQGAARSLTLRLLLAASIWLVAALTAGGFTLLQAFRDYVVSDFDARLTQTLDHMIGASELVDGFIRFTRPLADPRYTEPYSGWYWQVSEPDIVPFRSRSLWDQALEPDWARPAFEGRIVERGGPSGQRLRVAVRDARLPGDDRVFRYMAAGDTARIEADISNFRGLIIRSMSFLGAGLLLAIWLQVRFGLRPLRNLRTGLARIRSGRARRLEGDHPREIEPLVDEMNALIAHSERLVERSRMHAGNLAHALKTPLTVLKGEARQAGDPLAGRLETLAGEMQRHIDHHLKRARMSGGAGIGVITPLEPVVDRLLRAMRKIHPDADIRQHAPVAAGNLLFRGEEQDLTEMIGNLLDNACKWSSSKVDVRLATTTEAGRNMLKIEIADDGPGMTPDNIAAAFARGARLDESRPGDGLGLSIVRELAGLYGGRINLTQRESGGLVACLVLPGGPAEAV